MDCPKRSALAGLPDEAMLEILARVPFRSVCRSKCVAKAWRDLIDDPLNRGRLPQTMEGFLSIFYPSFNSDIIEHFFVKYSASSSVPLDDLDPCFSFLAKLPEIETFHPVDSCNGLLLFNHNKKLKFDELGYIVCNPTTKHWATVPVCAPSKARFQSDTFLAFDPAVSSHFHLICFWKEGPGEIEKNTLAIEKIMMSVPLSVSTYSSETGVWSHSQTDWNEKGQLEGWLRHFGFNQRTFVNGLLHLMVSDRDLDRIVVVDVQGRTKRTIETPAAAQRRRSSTASYIGQSQGCLGQSQGCLHYISHEFDSHLDFRQEQNYEVSIWALQDHDTQEWVLKDTISRRMIGSWVQFLVIHPDRNVVFLFEPLDRLILAYDMDSKELSVVATLSDELVGLFVPYIPCFLPSPALTNNK